MPHEHHAGHRHFDPAVLLSMEEARRRALAAEEVLGDFLQRDDAVRGQDRSRQELVFGRLLA
ncbi:MAG: hypothetical protein M0Z66_12875 [Thermaerobacter sp.]|nr:hypothetical protein [Thermaerobacter sp.]